MFAFWCLVAGIVAGSIAAWSWCSWYYEGRHDCLPHEPDVCRGVHGNNEMRTRFRGSRP